MSESALIDNRELGIQEQVEECLNYLTLVDADEIYINDTFWEHFNVTCTELVNYILQTKSMRSITLVNLWLQCLEVIINNNDSKLTNRLTDGVIKSVFHRLLNEDVVFPPWFVKSFFDFTFESIHFDDYVLTTLYSVVCNCKDYNVQKTFIEIISRNFDANTVHDKIIKNIVSKELQALFNNILEDDNEGAIRAYLNKLNNVQTPVRIFSFKSKEIKFCGIPLLTDAWIDINIFARTITFSCNKHDLSMDANTPNSSDDDDEREIITMKMCNINHLRYKSNKSTEYNVGDELILELKKPARGYFETSSQFLQNFMIVWIYILENTERVNNFFYNYYIEKLETLPGTLDNSNFEINFEHDKETSSMSSTVQLSTSGDSQLLENLNKENVGDPRKFRKDNDCSGSSEVDEEQSGSKGDELSSQLPRPCMNVSVEESLRTDESIRSDTEVGEYEYLNYDSTLIAAPKIISTNVSVATSCPSQGDSGIDKENTDSFSKIVPRTDLSGSSSVIPDTQYISVRTPEMINVFSPEIMNLITPDSPPITLRTENCDDIFPEESQTEKEELNLPPVEKLVVEEQCHESQQTGECEDDVSLVKRVAQNTPNEDQQSQESNRTRSSQNKKSLSQASQSSSASSRARKRRRAEIDPLYHPGDNLSNSYKINENYGNRRTRRYLLKEDNEEVDDEQSEFDDSSFFSSDKEKDKDTDQEYTYTRTRRVKKPEMYQSSSDTEPSKRKLRTRKNVEVLPSPVKRIKTILPVRKPENTSNAFTAANNTNTDLVREERNEVVEKRGEITNMQNIPSCSSAINGTNADLMTEQRVVSTDTNKVNKRKQTTTVQNVDHLCPTNYSKINTGVCKNNIQVIPTNTVDKKRRLTNVNNADHLEEQPQSETFKISVPPLKNQKNKKSLDLQTTQNCRQQFINKEVASTPHVGENLKEVFKSTPKQLDNFDKIKFNLPSTQTTMAPRKVSYFSSSSSSSQTSPALQISQPMEIDHEEIVPPIKEIAKVVPETTANENVPQAVAGPSNQIIPGPAKGKGPSRSAKADEKVARARKPRKPKDPKDTEIIKKPKRAAKKNKANESEPPISKAKPVARKEKINEKSPTNENLNQPTTSGVAPNAPHNVAPNIPNFQEEFPIISLSSTQENSPCTKCGLTPTDAIKEIQEAIKHLCKLCVMTFTSETRNEYCTQMEKFFKNMKK